MLDKFVNPTIFIISFAVCLVIVYFTNPEPVVIYRFPNPDNAGKLTYQDKNKNCYKIILSCFPERVSFYERNGFIQESITMRNNIK